MQAKRHRHGPTRAFAVALALTTGMASGKAAAADLWTRMADGMQLSDPAHAEVNAAAKYYSRHPRQLNETLDRSRPYLWHIVNAVEKRGMPMEIALLPAIESGFDTSARSARRAAGLWQFVPATARLYGLHSTTDYDGRRDPMASTQAALAYLDRLHDNYGDWLLVLAAYNSGDLRVAKEMHVAHSRDFWKLKLPKETRAHVCRLLGLARVIAQPQEYQVQLPSIPDKALTQALVLEQPRNLAAAALQAGIPRESIASYNPGLRSLANTADQHTVLLLPSDATKLRKELARADYPASTARTDKTLTAAAAGETKKHKIASGDNLWTIARRYRVSVRELKAWNHLRDNAVLKPGHQLVVALAK